ncbi:hypothetical protein BRADI_3g58103v3 [Brachypodium distachyon]|uniref:Uncharacterized protein n=1 Tax=Brachypodium distachyon TaxID=15368 RepID=A0A2K2D5L7_BRADI|nr:hypothetical protein BRADI_3g58103v3 [Brachypodium distachyon]
MVEREDPQAKLVRITVNIPRTVGKNTLQAVALNPWLEYIIAPCFTLAQDSSNTSTKASSPRNEAAGIESNEPMAER